jgi:hypothetical protein
MLYSEILNTPYVAEALKKACVHEIESPLMPDGDFSTHFDEKSLVDYRNKIIDLEVLARRNYLAFQEKMAEHEQRMAPYKKIEAKENAVKPFIKKMVSGNLREPFQHLEDAVIDCIAQRCAKNYDFSPEGEVMADPEPGQLSELNALLHRAGVVRLSAELTVEEMAFRTLYGSGFCKFLK